MEMALLIIGLFFLSIVAFIVGRLLDPFKRAWLLRTLTKTDWGCLGIVSPDAKSIRFVVVNLGKDVVVHKGKIWIVLKDRIYRHDKPERGINLKKPDLPIKWIEGIPTIYVNETSYEPIDIIGKVGEVRPEEVDAVLSSWVSNQFAKMVVKILGAFKNMQTMVMIGTIFAIMAAVFAYLTWQSVGEVKDALASKSQMIERICYKTGACIEQQPGVVIQPVQTAGDQHGR